MAKKITVEIEIPEGKSIEEVLRGVKYRIIDPVSELEKILESAKKKKAKIDRIPTREEIYADRTRY